MKPEEIPQELVDILNERAGKIHSKEGQVLTTLAEILTRHEELVIFGILGQFHRSMIDIVTRDGEHHYWSTHCRHASAEEVHTRKPSRRHKDCASSELSPGVPRKPSQCKTCSAPCVCSCHYMEGDQNG